ncbi:MAG: hypothetical protein AUJ97_07485 [Bacteroidetes bacterium CG2_30_32_10]|nr:MAG: hypothetical protein AUJ97_07485 [Bacteroidetes bacterium CG2_30_32_10]
MKINQNQIIMKKILMLLLTLIMVITVNTIAFSQQNKSDVLFQNSETDSILRTAKNQIHLLIDNIPEANLNDYGFNNKAEFEKISFAPLIKIYTLKDTSIIFTNTWRVPVVVDNEYRSLLTIINEDGVYKAVDYGASILAKAFLAKKTNQTIGLLRVYELKSDFLMEVNTQNQLKFVPIENANSNLYDLTDIINLIKNN